VLIADWHPFEGGTVAEAVVEGGGGDAAQGEEVVVAEFGLVFRVQAHLLDAEGDFGFGVFDLVERVFGLLFVVDVEFHEARARAAKAWKWGGNGMRGSSRLRLAA